MLSFDDYKSTAKASTLGEERKRQSDVIMEATWDGDIATKTMYFFDCDHDPEPTKLKDLDMWKYKKLPSMRCKYLQGSYQSMDKDTVPFKLQMLPSQEVVVPYYDKVFKDRYSATYPVGLYVVLPNEKGMYEKWLVVATADDHALQFPTFQILPCDYVLNWVYGNKRYSMSGCLRSQNSYNSGVWLADRVEITEDQQKIALPMNRISELLFYNQRVIIDNFVLTEPRTWRISKVNRIAYNGTAIITFAQTEFDPDTDYIEKDADGNVIAFWASYYTNGVAPREEEITPLKRGEITSLGKNPQIRLGGGYKKLDVHIYEGDTEVEFEPGEWNFYVGEEEISEKLQILTTIDSKDTELNQIKIKLPNDNNSNEALLGKKIKVVFHSLTGITAEYELSIVSL